MKNIKAQHLIVQLHLSLQGKRKEQRTTKEKKWTVLPSPCPLSVSSFVLTTPMLKSNILSFFPLHIGYNFFCPELFKLWTIHLSTWLKIIKEIIRNGLFILFFFIWRFWPAILPTKLIMETILLLRAEDELSCCDTPKKLEYHDHNQAVREVDLERFKPAMREQIKTHEK